MTTMEKLIFLKQHGVSLTYIAKQVNCSQQALGMWIKGQSKVSARLEKDVENAIQVFVGEMEGLK